MALCDILPEEEPRDTRRWWNELEHLYSFVLAQIFPNGLSCTLSGGQPLSLCCCFLLLMMRIQNACKQYECYVKSISVLRSRKRSLLTSFESQNVSQTSRWVSLWFYLYKHQCHRTVETKHALPFGLQQSLGPSVDQRVKPRSQVSGMFLYEKHEFDGWVSNRSN